MKSIFLYPGSKGKKTDLEQILPLIPEHNEYREPFLGGGSIFLNKYITHSIINDINCELMNCYKAIKKDPEKVINYLPQIDTKKEEFKQLWLEFKDNENFDEFKSAAAFIFINRTSYQGFGGILSNKFQRYNFELMKNRILECNKFLVNAQIYCGDGIEWINYNSDKEVFIFIDPPYINSNNKACYKKINWTYSDFVRLCEELKRCKYKWLMTIDKHEIVYQNLKEFNIKEYSWKKFKAITGQHNDKELYVSNY